MHLHEAFALVGGKAEVILEEYGLLTLSRKAPGRELFQIDSKQGITAADGVVKESERPVALECQEPEREFRHLDSKLIAVHAIQAALHHDTQRVQATLIEISRD